MFIEIMEALHTAVVKVRFFNDGRRNNGDKRSNRTHPFLFFSTWLLDI